MNPRSDHQMRIADEDRWHSLLGGLDDDAVPPFDAESFATELRQRFRRRARRRWLVGGGISTILLLAVVARPRWDQIAPSPQTADPPGFARLESNTKRNTMPADNIAAEAAIKKLDSAMTQLGSDIKALSDAERPAEERRRLQKAASRITDQIRQQAEISVFSSFTRPDSPAS